MKPETLVTRAGRPWSRALPVAVAALWALLWLGGSGSLTGCSDFNRALKSDSIEYKVEVAEKYFAKGDYDRAMPLLEELIALSRGTARSERVNYLYAKSIYGSKDYILAGYYLDNFAKTFPTSQFAEECTFLSALCYYKNSPEWELDQTDTEAAIDQFQNFLAFYPMSTLKDSCNTLIDQLRGKLERKDWENAKQYFRLRNYESASTALRNFARKWPNSRYREEALLTILRSDHDLAMNSVEQKRADRAAEGIRAFNNFADAFPESASMDEARRLHQDLLHLQERHTKRHTP
ncbi:MAG: outer membrane protein assembly factor BamD [Flavobacteriales bacterium]|nr:outer membrane protein assembly factor BamD [Flavobacteriales bacterium]